MFDYPRGWSEDQMTKSVSCNFPMHYYSSFPKNMMVFRSGVVVVVVARPLPATEAASLQGAAKLGDATEKHWTTWDQILNLKEKWVWLEISVPQDPTVQAWVLEAFSHLPSEHAGEQ